MTAEVNTGKNKVLVQLLMVKALQTVLRWLEKHPCRSLITWVLGMAQEQEESFSTIFSQYINIIYKISCHYFNVMLGDVWSLRYLEICRKGSSLYILRGFNMGYMQSFMTFGHIKVLKWAFFPLFLQHKIKILSIYWMTYAGQVIPLSFSRPCMDRAQVVLFRT